MNENELMVVKFTNIADFDFTGELGARYGGRDFLIPAGESRLYPKNVGEHLAKHLAQAIKIKGAPAGKGPDTKLWSDLEIQELTGKIVTHAYEEQKQKTKTEDDILMEKIESLNAVAADGDQNTQAVTTGQVYRDKAAVITELKKRNVTFDARLPKNKLEELLKGSETAEVASEQTTSNE